MATMFQAKRTGLLAITLAAAGASALAAATPSFTAQQATAGKAVYEAQCAACHSSGGAAPPLNGVAFASHWTGKSAADYFTKIAETMPPTDPGSLSHESVAAVIAYIFSLNGIAAGDAALPASAEALAGQTIPAPPVTATPPASAEEDAMIARPTARPVGPVPPILRAITPVTDAMLRSPSPGDWLIWRRTYDSHGFSPLDQINRQNVGQLKLAWSWSLAPGPMETTPIVHDGVLFIQSGMATVQAIDAATGDLLWTYDRQLPPEVRSSFNLLAVKRSMAIYQDKLIVATADTHVVALDVRTGRVIWDQAVADYHQTFMLTSGPIVARGKVFQGISGSYAKQAGGAGIVALDAETGRQVWRFNTVAHPGEPGGNSWNDLPIERRSGGSVWVPGSYDPETNLLYFGTGQSYDTVPLRTRSTKRGVTNDALYTDTTLAIDPDTGRLVWHFQHLPNDQWDHDWAFERTVITLNTPQGPKRMVVTGGKQAIFEGLDARTGRYGFNYDFGLQSVISAIDPRTGAKTINPQTVFYGDNRARNTTCPTAFGARNWIATSYDDASHLLYIPLDPSCTMGLRSHLAAEGDVGSPGTDEADPQLGYIAALDLQTRQVAWTERTRAPQTSAMLATAGGLLFNSNLDRWFRANDARTGAELWKVRLADVANSFPITYSVGGKQYIAIASGGGSVLTGAKANIAAQFHLPGNNAAVLWVFELP